MNTAGVLVAVFLACLVEAVEAATVVLAAGAGRDWRSALTGAAAAVAGLAVLIAALGPALEAVPLRWLRLLVGAVLLIFGLNWLGKAILRAARRRAVRDEDAVYTGALAASRAAAVGGRGAALDWWAFTLAGKAVLLEGLEVVVIVIGFAGNQHRLTPAVAAAAAAVLLVTALVAAVRRPLARVPQNVIKFAVAIMLVAFGTFWSGEGAGARWPGSDAALVVILAAVALYTLATALILRRRGVAPAAVPAEPLPRPPRPARSAGVTALRRAARFWWRFFLGEDWVVAATVATALLVTALISHLHGRGWWVMPVAVLVLVPLGVRRNTA